MSHYEKYIGIVNKLVMCLWEEKTPEDRFKYLNYVVEQVLKRLLDAELIGIERSICESDRCKLK